MQFFRSVVPTCCIRIHADALINTSVGLIHREEGDIYQGINRETKTRQTSVKGTRLTASAGLLNDRQTKCAIFEKLLKPTWCTANWSLSRESSMLMWKSTGCEPETATLPPLQSAVMKRTFPDDKICFVKFRTSGQTGQQACQLQLVPQRLSHFTLSLYRVHITTRQTYSYSLHCTDVSVNLHIRLDCRFKAVL